MCGGGGYRHRSGLRWEWWCAMLYGMAAKKVEAQRVYKCVQTLTGKVIIVIGAKTMNEAIGYCEDMFGDFPWVAMPYKRH